MARHPDAERTAQAAHAIAVGKTVPQAAEASGYSKRSIFRLMRDPHFRELVREFRDRLFDRAAGQSAQGIILAVRTLVGVLSNETIKPEVRVRACTAMASIATDLRELHDLRERVAALEDQLFDSTDAHDDAMADHLATHDEDADDFEEPAE